MGFHVFIILLLLLLAVLTIGVKENKVQKKIYLFLTFCVLFFISAFRSKNIGNDTGAYINLYDIFGRSSSAAAYNSGIEAGYVFLNRVLFSITDNWFILLAVISFFVLAIEMIFIYRNSNNVWLSVFLFINLRLFYFTLTGLRQSIAIAIVLISYKFVKEKRILLFILCILTASLFHTSALGMIILYPLAHFKFNKSTILIGTSIAILVFMLFERYLLFIVNLLPTYSNYLDSKYLDAGVKLASFLEFLVIIVIFIFVIITTRKNRDNLTSDVNFMLNTTFIGVLVGFLALRTIMLDRYLLYFTAFIIIFLPNAINNLQNKKLRIITIYIVLIMFMVYNLVILYFKPEWNHLYPYEFNFNF